MSIARKHKQRVIAQQAALSSQERTNYSDGGHAGDKHPGAANSIKASFGAVPAELQLIEKQLSGDVETLKILKGDQQREPLKKDLIEKYRPLCEWYIQHFDDWGHLESLAWWLVWRADSELFIGIEPLLYRAITQGLTTPMGFKGDWQSWYCDLVKNEYSDTLKIEATPEPLILGKVITDIVNGDIVLNQPLKAKLFALYGKVSALNNDHKTAANAFEKALGFDEAVGVKKLLKISQARLENEPVESQETEDQQVKNQQTKEGESNAE